MMSDEKATELLTDLVSQLGLSETLQLISQICSDKADEIRTSGVSGADAILWEDSANMVTNLSTQILV